MSRDIRVSVHIAEQRPVFDERLPVRRIVQFVVKVKRHCVVITEDIRYLRVHHGRVACDFSSPAAQCVHG